MVIILTSSHKLSQIAGMVSLASYTSYQNALSTSYDKLKVKIDKRELVPTPYIIHSEQSSSKSPGAPLVEHFLVLPSNISCMVKQLLKFPRGSHALLTHYTKDISVTWEQVEVVDLYLVD